MFWIFAMARRRQKNVTTVLSIPEIQIVLYLYFYNLIYEKQYFYLLVTQEFVSLYHLDN